MTKQSSLNLFEKFLKPMRKIGKAIGMDVFDPNYKFGVKSIILTCIAAFVVISYTFMVLKNYPLSTLLEGLTITTLTSQALHKLYVGAVHHANIRYCFNTIYTIHETHKNDVRYQPKLKLCVSRCITMFKVLMMAYSSVMCSYSILPVFIYYYYGVKTTIIPVHFPFIDVNRLGGFLLNTFHQIVFMLCGCFGVLFADMIFFMFVLHSTTFVALIKFNYEDLNNMLISGQSHLDVLLKNKLAECVKVHQQYLRYILGIQAIYADNCLVQIVTSEGLLTLSLFLIVWNKWIIGPFLVIASFFQLLGYCVLGTVIQFQNENICNIIYKCYWYLLPVTLQKHFVVLLMSAQQSPELAAGKFAKLNVQTCMQILKTTYSYLMLVLEFIES